MTEPSGGPSRRGLIQGSLVAGALLASGAVPVAQGAAAVTVPQYLLRRLKSVGCGVLFGVPGATCDPLFQAAHEGGELEVVTTSSDLNAGYAADGYARVKGISAVSVTYGVGAMALLPVVAGAYAERSPMVILSGGPSSKDLRLEATHGALFSHSSGHGGADLKLFREVTAAAVRVERAADVPKATDDALRVALQTQRPVYLEIAKHLWWASCPGPVGTVEGAPTPLAGDAAAAEAVLRLLGSAKRPLVLVGAEVGRFGLQDALSAFLRDARLPWASTLLGKGVLDETTPGFVGVYRGRRSLPASRAAVEGSDALCMVGCVLGRQLRTVATEAGPGVRFRVQQGEARLPSGTTPVSLPGVVASLAAAPPSPRAAPPTLPPRFADRRDRLAGLLGPDEPGMTYDDAIAAVAASVEGRPETVVVSDTSLSMYPAADIGVKQGGYVCNGVWNAIGFSVPAAIGVGRATGARPVVICGDGGFQMTGQALSTLARRRIPAVVLVLDNGVYGIEQWLLDPAWHAGGGPPRDYLALQRWRYAELARSMGVGFVAGVSSRQELEVTLAEAFSQPGPALLQVAVRPHDLPAELET